MHRKPLDAGGTQSANGGSQSANGGSQSANEGSQSANGGNKYLASQCPGQVLATKPSSELDEEEALRSLLAIRLKEKYVRFMLNLFVLFPFKVN